jgi:APA family basic amino acid/polyamine antiporter
VSVTQTTTSTSGHGQLLRILGVSFGVAVSIGTIIGAGILRTPGEVAGHLQKPWLITTVWFLGGIYALLGTLCIIELGTMLPLEGGWYAYARRAFGPYGGFVVGFMDWIVQSVGMAYSATALGEFCIELWPSWHGQIRLIAVSTMFILTVLNWIGLKLGSRAQEVTSVIKALALVGLVIVCFTLPQVHSVAIVSVNSNIPQEGLLLGMVLAFQAVIATYDGWYSAIYFMEEDRDPVRNLPRSAIGGVLLSIFIFMLINLAFMHVLPIHLLAASKIPAADAASVILGGRGRQLVLIIAVITLISLINSLMLIAPRILFAIGRDGLFFHRVTDINSGGTPAIALGLSAAIAIGLILSGNFSRLIAIASVMFVAIYVSGFAALFVLRKREPNLVRPFRVWGYPLTPMIVLLGSIAFLIGSAVEDWMSAVFTLGVIVLTYPVYLLMQNRIGTNS